MSDRVIKLREATFEAEARKHEGLLCRWAMQFTAGRPTVDVEEVMNVGRLVMWECWDKYTEDMGVKFISFVTIPVKRRMLWEACRLGETIHVPRQSTYRAWAELRVPVSSMDEQRPCGADEEGGWTLGERLASAANDPSAEAELSGNLERMMQLVNMLPGRQREAVQICRLKGLTLKEAAVIMGVSHQRVGQIVSDGIAALRRAMLRRPALTCNQRRNERRKNLRRAA